MSRKKDRYCSLGLRLNYSRVTLISDVSARRKRTDPPGSGLCVPDASGANDVTEFGIVTVTHAPSNHRRPVGCTAGFSLFELVVATAVALLAAMVSPGVFRCPSVAVRCT